MVITLGPLTEIGRSTLDEIRRERGFGKDGVTGSTNQKIEETLKVEESTLSEGTEKLPSGLPQYAYDVDENFKDEEGIYRDTDMMKKINDAVLDMRKKGILDTKEMEGGVYTTVKLPGMNPIHFLEPDLAEYSDDDFKSSYEYTFGGKKIKKNEVKLGGMRGKVNDWKNKKLKKYLEEKKIQRLEFPTKDIIKNFMYKLAEYVNQQYDCNITGEKDQIDLFCRSMNSVGAFWLADYKNGSRSVFRCHYRDRCFGSNDDDNNDASLFLTDCLL